MNLLPSLRHTPAPRPPGLRLSAIAIVAASCAAGVLSPLLGGCAGRGAPDADLSRPRLTSGPTAPPTAGRPAPERMSDSGDAVATRDEAERDDRPPPPAAGFALPRFSEDPRLVRAEVARFCGEGMPVPLPELVSGLYLSGIDPGTAVESLIRGRCGEPTAIVREMVAQGGDEVLAEVVGRARRLTDPGLHGSLARAASAGLDRNLTTMGAGAAPIVAGRTHGMAYFSSADAQPWLVGALALNRLHEEAIPGYGLYVFVIAGAGQERLAEADQLPYREMLRTIETYVAAPAAPDSLARTDAAAFLVPIFPDGGTESLVDRANQPLSDLMRQTLGRRLRQSGQAALANRLERRRGPFLVLSPEPRLLPDAASDPRLILDLSWLGPEHAFAVVDACDRPLPPAGRERSEALAALRARLETLASEAGADDWLFWVGRQPR